LSVSERIFSLLKKSKRKQSELAAYIGVKPNTVSGWKNEGSTPSTDLIPLIADFFGVSTDYILTGTEFRKNLNNKLSEQEAELLRIFNLLDIRKQTALLSYAYKLEDEN